MTHIRRRAARSHAARPWAVVFALLATAGAAPAQTDTTSAAPESDDAEGARHGFFGMPFLFYQPETGFGGGGGLLHTFRPEAGARANTDQLLIVATEKRQYAVTLATESYLWDGAWMVDAEVTGFRFPDLYYGLGNDTRLGDEESFTLDRAGVTLDVRKRLARDVYLGPSIAYQYTDPHGFETSGELADGIPTGTEGGVVAGIGASLLVDGRDDTLTPTRGVYVESLARIHDSTVGSDFTYTRLEIDARAYWTIRPGQVLAVQALATGQTGDPPFFELATLGGERVLRGSYDGRYRDRSRLFGQAEYRFHAWRRLGGAVFLGGGAVARDPGDLRLDGTHLAGGAGLRFLISRKENVNLRVDFGFAEGESGVYFGFAEAF